MGCRLTVTGQILHVNSQSERSKVRGQWSQVTGQRSGSEVSVQGQRSEIISQRLVMSDVSQVRGQKSQVTGQGQRSV